MSLLFAAEFECWEIAQKKSGSKFADAQNGGGGGSAGWICEVY